MSRDEGPRDNGRSDQEHKAFVGGISWHMNGDELKDTFRQKGHRARSASVMLDKMTNRSRGFGFVTFDSDKELMDAIASMHDSELDGRKISCTKAIPQSETAPGTPASALAGGRERSGSWDRHRDRAYDRFERPPPRGYSARAYDDRRGGYDRGGYGYGRPDRGYERGGYGPEYDRGYDRSHPPPAYGYERDRYPGGYGPEPAGYAREGYPPERGYAGAGYDAGYSDRGAYGSGSGSGYGGAAYDRGYDDRGYGGREAYGSRGAAPARDGAYSRQGPDRALPERDYARPAARAPGPYDRPPAGMPPR